MSIHGPGKIPKHERERQRAERRELKDAKRDLRRAAKREAHLGHPSMTDPTEPPMLGAVARMLGRI